MYFSFTFSSPLSSLSHQVLNLNTKIRLCPVLSRYSSLFWHSYKKPGTKMAHIICPYLCTDQLVCLLLLSVWFFWIFRKTILVDWVIVNHRMCHSVTWLSCLWDICLSCLWSCNSYIDSHDISGTWYKGLAFMACFRAGESATCWIWKVCHGIGFSQTFQFI